VLKLARPEWEVGLLDATRRRANFLRHVVRELSLTGVEVHWGRAEALASGPLAGRFRTVTMRAVAPGAVAATLAAPFLASDGHLVVSTGPTGMGPGTRREVVLDLPGELSWRRRFLIIRPTARGADVPRGTGRTAEP
jgi:16S rRNA G527 N7-methylase RsmG